MTITTIIFDVDDTLYDAATGFTQSRTGDVVFQFMVDTFGFADTKAAQALWTEYFERYHATAKALLVAQQEGKFPVHNTRQFNAQDLAQYWVDHLDYTQLGGVKSSVIQDFVGLKRSSSLRFVAFSNGPRQYVKKVLSELGLWETLFDDETLFCVDDVLPYCKPEAQAFQVIFDKVGVTDPAQCIMVEDSMKNIRQAKRMGMKTVLVCGSNYNNDNDDNTNNSNNGLTTTSRLGDYPMPNDAAVDVAIARIEDFRSKVPGLWKTPVSFPE